MPPQIQTPSPMLCLTASHSPIVGSLHSIYLGSGLLKSFLVGKYDQKNLKISKTELQVLIHVSPFPISILKPIHCTWRRLDKSLN